MDWGQAISERLKLALWQVENTVELWNKDATIPFISRYRKEATGSLNETEVSAVIDQYRKIVELDKRRETIFRTIVEQGKLTDELRLKLIHAASMAELEDLYLPHKPKKKTRAMLAREKGLELLADAIMKQQENNFSAYAEKFINDQVKTVAEALQGARDIIAERVSENQNARNEVRRLFSRTAIIASHVMKGKENEGVKYTDYFDFSELLHRCPSHRLLAIYRAESEGILRVSIEPDEKHALESLSSLFIKSKGEHATHMLRAIADSYKRLLKPSMENEFRAFSKESADAQAIQVFAENLRQLLMAPPLGKARVLAIDPGYRSGCKIVCLDEQGSLLHNETIFPHPPQNELKTAGKKISTMVNAYKIDAIAVGNGTAGRETESFLKRIKFDRQIRIFIVSEAGASVYSASKTAREELPSYDVTVRGAVSIGRRLIDPLAELVKIDPKAIGVGQYQHDVDQNKLKESLDRMVESCVNAVGVDVNTASKHLLTYISGLGHALAQNIVAYRSEHGPFKTREEFKHIPRMGTKAFELSAGFLRIRDGIDPLDNSSVHPESYYIVKKIARDLNRSIPEIMNDAGLKNMVKMEKYVDGKTGIPTLSDILDELTKPGRDPRQSAKILEFAGNIHSIEDVKPGMILPGIVTNITGFGVFVDIGIKENGLIHISQVADRYVSNPADVVKLHQHLKVKVLEVDLNRKRIQLTLKESETGI
ncbi:MAG: RNA-binding transcriptional accessory protein [Bacteroidales bacterium]|nr:RNA-binding transcriptional accessory protein [Bacteroidales bacterium]